jgi:hypothetical protein
MDAWWFSVSGVGVGVMVAGVKFVAVGEGVNAIDDSPEDSLREQADVPNNSKRNRKRRIRIWDVDNCSFIAYHEESIGVFSAGP